MVTIPFLVGFSLMTRTPWLFVRAVSLMPAPLTRTSEPARALTTTRVALPQLQCRPLKMPMSRQPWMPLRVPFAHLIDLDVGLELGPSGFVGAGGLPVGGVGVGGVVAGGVAAGGAGAGGGVPVTGGVVAGGVPFGGGVVAGGITGGVLAGGVPAGGAGGLLEGGGGLPLGGGVPLQSCLQGGAGGGGVAPLQGGFCPQS